VGTDDFTDAVIERLGQKPETLSVCDYASGSQGIILPPLKEIKEEEKLRVGVDIGLNFTGSADDLAAKINPCLTDNLELSLISNRGVKVWPQGAAETFCTDNWRLRFLGKNQQSVKTSEVVQLLSNLNGADMNFTNALMLHTFDGVEGFTKAQGE
jgi:isocitrate dehydrogenase